MIFRRLFAKTGRAARPLQPRRQRPVSRTKRGPARFPQAAADGQLLRSEIRQRYTSTNNSPGKVTINVEWKSCETEKPAGDAIYFHLSLQSVRKMWMNVRRVWKTASFYATLLSLPGLPRSPCTNKIIQSRGWNISEAGEHCVLVVSGFTASVGWGDSSLDRNTYYIIRHQH